MKKLFYILLVVTLAITTANAQQSSKRKFEGKGRIEGRNNNLTAEQRAEKLAIDMQKRLSLSDDQKQKVQSIQLDRIKKGEEWRKKDEKALRSKMEERKAFMNSSKEKMDKILTEEQRAKLANSRKDLHDRMKENRGRGPGRPGAKTPPVKK
ncbi:MAG: hypothetical protein EOO90_07740 [Pedobacter sp.]|nr:MAG: hypothetical protein EOO90_07740 [Pedobacter sp.]